MYDDDTTTRSTPRLADGITGPVVVPLLQAIVTGILVGICSAALTALVFPAGPWFTVFLVAWPVSTLASWLAYRARWQYVVERVLGVDINQDGVIGDPADVPQYQPLRVIVDQDNGRSRDIIDLPYHDRIPALAAGLVEGRTFKAETFSHIFSRLEFETVRDEMIRRNLARWKNERAHAQGAELTAAGRAVMRRITEVHNPTPTLPGPN